jgi:hypothetical protein
MTELLAVLTSIYVLYVLYEIFKTVSQSDLATPAVTMGAAEPAAAPSQAAPPPETPAPNPASAPPAEPVAASAPPEPAKSLRNPETGEVSPVPGNYRFAKKWIKEAMVAEGLLKKVYKNSELTEAVNPVVKTAIEEFKRLEKYQA